jgi:hypothetical protein
MLISHEILNEMPSLKDQRSVTFPSTCGPRNKNFSKHSLGSALGEREGCMIPKTPSNTKHNSRTLAKGAKTWRLTGISTRKHLD